MRATVIVAFIAAFPPTLAAILGYLASSRSLRKRVGEPTSVPLSQIVERVDAKVDALLESQTTIRERIARLEGRYEPRFRPGVAKR
jgi:hypothetical protein